MVVGREGIHTKGDTVQKRISTLAAAWHVDSYMATAVPINILDLIGAACQAGRWSNVTLETASPTSGRVWAPPHTKTNVR